MQTFGKIDDQIWRNFLRNQKIPMKQQNHKKTSLAFF